MKTPFEVFKGRFQQILQGTYWAATGAAVAGAGLAVPAVSDDWAGTGVGAVDGATVEVVSEAGATGVVVVVSPDWAGTAAGAGVSVVVVAAAGAVVVVVTASAGAGAVVASVVVVVVVVMASPAAGAGAAIISAWVCSTGTSFFAKNAKPPITSRTKITIPMMNVLLLFSAIGVSLPI